MPDPQQLSALLNLGVRSARMLEAAGIANTRDLRQAGSVEAFMRVKAAGFDPSLNLLWALEGAITTTPWQTVARQHRTSLLLALDARERAKVAAAAA